ncbi:hypothetical protein DV737_g4149, partial [Chaetothyriales sp. CBS 132003]
MATGGSTRGTTVVWGDYGLRMKDHDRRVSAKQLKLGEETIKRRLRGMHFKLFTRVCANIGVIPVSRIIFELKGELHEKVAREAFRLAGAKMPGTYEFVKKGDAPLVGITKLGNGVTLQTLKDARRPVERKDPEPQAAVPPAAEQPQYSVPAALPACAARASFGRSFTNTHGFGQDGGSAASLRASARKRNQTTMYYGLSLGVAVVALSYASVPLYKMICQQTGWSGQPVKAHNEGADSAQRLRPVEDHRRLRITFQGSVSDVLPWKFTPQQREVRVLPGETALAFYTATNKSKADIIGVATYSVTPAQVAPYFSKIQCFCFEEQRLAAGETVDMPVFFFIDPDFVKDPNMRGIDTITLSYTFFKAKYDKNGVLTTVPMAMA